jgi:hypothetical protein
MATGVDGLYCKRPIQCLASSEILTLPPPALDSIYVSTLWVPDCTVHNVHVIDGIAETWYKSGQMEVIFVNFVKVFESKKINFIR